MADSPLVKLYKKLAPDILEVLASAKKPLSQQEIYNRRKISNYHINAWSYALDYLEKLGLIEFVDPYHWIIKGKVFPNDISLDYLINLKDYVGAKLPPV